MLSFIDRADAAYELHDILSAKVSEHPIPSLEDIQELLEQLSLELEVSNRESMENGYRRMFGPPELYLQSRLERLIDGVRSLFRLPKLYSHRSGIKKLIDSFRLADKPQTLIKFSLSGQFR